MKRSLLLLKQLHLSEYQDMMDHIQKTLEEDVFFDDKVGAYIECAKRNKILIDTFLNDMKV